MVAMKGQMLATIVVINVAVICSSVSFYSSSFVNGGEATTSAASRVHVATSLSAKESFGWFDDILDEGWQPMKHRARTGYSVHGSFEVGDRIPEANHVVLEQPSGE
jgi:hypothetical protein